MSGSRKSRALVPVGRVLAVAVIAVACGAPATSATAGALPPGSPRAAAANGVITGSVPRVPASLTRLYRPTVTAYRLDSAGAVASVRPRPGSTYRLSVPAGLWAVSGQAWSKSGLTSTLKAAPVARGATTTVRGTTRAPIPRTRIALADWKAAGSFPTVVVGGLDDYLSASLQIGSDCKAPGGLAEVVPRTGRLWQAIQQEIRLGMSRYASPEFRAMAKRAIATLPKWAPTHSVTGTMSQRGDALTATVTLVNNRTKRIEWSKSYTGSDPFSMLDKAGADLSSHLCSPVGFPATYQGSIGLDKRLELGAGMVETTRWTGNATYRLSHQATNPDGSRLALYDLTGMTLEQSDYGTDGAAVTCTVPTSSGPGVVKAGDLEIQVSPAGAWTSALLIDVTAPTSTMTCVTKTDPPQTTTSAFDAAVFLNTRTASGGLRAMEPSGHVLASAVTDFMEVATFPGATGTASWDLAPIG